MVNVIVVEPASVVELLVASAEPPDAVPIANKTLLVVSGLLIMIVWQLSGMATAGATVVVVVAEAVVAT